MPRNPLTDKFKTLDNLFEPQRKTEGLELISYYEGFPTPTDALNQVLKALNGLYILTAQNQFSDTQQRKRREFDIALLSTLKAIYYGMEKSYNNFSEFPILTDNISINAKLLQEWSDANIESINTVLTSKK